ncbi:hypothetical protein AB4511_26480, partial [Vibrio sp. 10N.222.54.F6]|uniref:hypothetical protein n=1 Tax=Vibrio sp. 10N.222.54.F6 TaxID=3229645 RepID=UPI003552D9FF
MKSIHCKNVGVLATLAFIFFSPVTVIAKEDPRTCTSNMSTSCIKVTAKVTGVESIGEGRARLYVNKPDWADVHYRINNGPQQNVRMHQV